MGQVQAPVTAFDEKFCLTFTIFVTFALFVTLTIFVTFARYVADMLKSRPSIAIAIDAGHITLLTTYFVSHSSLHTTPLQLPVPTMKRG